MDTVTKTLCFLFGIPMIVGFLLIGFSISIFWTSFVLGCLLCAYLWTVGAKKNSVIHPMFNVYFFLLLAFGLASFFTISYPVIFVSLIMHIIMFLLIAVTVGLIAYFSICFMMGILEGLFQKEKA